MPEQTQPRQNAFEIHIRLKSLEALFNSLDPSPLVERDLDDTVEDYIVDCVRDAPHDASLDLVLHLPKSMTQKSASPSPTISRSSETGRPAASATCYAKAGRRPWSVSSSWASVPLARRRRRACLAARWAHFSARGW